METMSVLLLLLPVVVAWVAVFFIWPTAARARFTSQISEIRDDADDAVIDGLVPDGPEVRHFLEKTEYLRDNPRHLSFSLLVAIHLTLEQYGQVPESKAASYAELTPEQRKVMHKLDGRLEEAVASHVVRGSRFYSVFWCLVRIAGGRKRVAMQARKVIDTPRPTELASEFNRIQDPRPLLHA